MSDHVAERALRPVLRQSCDVGLRFMLTLLGFVLVCLVLVLLAAYLLFPREIRDRRFAGPFPRFPAPALQTNPPADMRAFYSEEMLRLNGVGWIDRTRGVVHMPIDQAMEAVAREGIAGWPTGPSPAAGSNGR